MNGELTNITYNVRPQDFGEPQAFKPEGKVREFEVFLDRTEGLDDSGVYFPGDTVNGHVRLYLKDKLSVTKLSLLIQGTGNVSWQTVNQQGRNLYADDEVYLNELAELITRKNFEYISLSKGEHIFPFSCDLPLNIPASFTASNGNVSYIVKIVLQAEPTEKAHRQPVIITKIFYVEDRINPAECVEFFQPYRQDLKTSLGKSTAFQIGSSSLKVSLFLPRRAYDIKDKIILNADVANNTKHTVRSMGVALVLSAIYKAENATHTERLIIVDKEDNFSFGHKEGRKWRNIDLYIPGLIPPSSLPHSNIIDIRYHLIFKLEVSGVPDVILRVPLVIGTAIEDVFKPGFESQTNGFRTPSMTSRAPSVTAAQSLRSPTYSENQSSIVNVQPTINYMPQPISNQAQTVVNGNGGVYPPYPSIPKKDYPSTSSDQNNTEHDHINVEDKQYKSKPGHRHAPDYDSHSITMKFGEDSDNSPNMSPGRMTKNPLFREDKTNGQEHKRLDDKLLFTKLNDTSYYSPDNNEQEVLY